MNQNIKTIECYSVGKEVVFLDFMPCKREDFNFIYDFYEVTNAEFLRIFQTDYTKLLIPHLNKLFPLTDPITLESQLYLDVCFDNIFGKKEWQKFLDILKDAADSTYIEQEKAFYDAFLLWHNKQLLWADILMVEGNQ